VSPYRARLYRLIFASAAIYNIAFGLWAAVRPLSFFVLFDLTPPVYPSIWACLGMVVGLYGLGYWDSSERELRSLARRLISLGILDEIQKLATQGDAVSLQRLLRIKKLILPGNMGERFKVLIQRRA